MSQPIAKKFIVSGRVQGVYYRASTRNKAHELALKGYARNLPDGTVEVLAVGPQSAVEALNKWLWIGPPAARVDQVVAEDAQVTMDLQGFDTG